MKQLKTLPLLFLLVLFAWSCQKTDEAIVPNNQNSIDKNTAQLLASINNNYNAIATISYTAIGLSSPNGQHNIVYDGYAEFFSDATSKSSENVGQINFGAIGINPNPAYYGTNNYYFTKLNKADSTNNKLWGSNTTFGIAGGGSYGAFNTSFYVPEVLFLNPQDSFYFNGNGLPNVPTISKDNPNFNLNWNADANNSKVTIVFFYDGSLSHAINANLPSATFSTFYTCSDLGNYAITSRNLNSFPVGSVVEVYVGRGNSHEIVTNGKPVNISANTFAKQTIIVGQ